MTLAFNPLNAELNPICHLLALLACHILHVSRIRVKQNNLHIVFKALKLRIDCHVKQSCYRLGVALWVPGS